MTTIIQSSFSGGKMEVKSGRKTIAKIYDRAEFFKGTRYENIFTQYPFSVEMFGGVFECKDLAEVNAIVNKYSA